MQKHKNDLISKLEGKTSAMAETLRKLDDKYVTYVIVCQVTLTVPVKITHDQWMPPSP